MKHYQYFSWPDHGVPAEPSGVLSFLDEVNRAQSSTPGAGPMVVHCRCDRGRGGRAVQVQPRAGPRPPRLTSPQASRSVPTAPASDAPARSS